MEKVRREKRRARRKKERTEFRVFAVMSSEKRFQDALEEQRVKTEAGMLVRNIDINADLNMGLGVFDHIGDYESSREFADAIKAFTEATYGTAGPMFLDKLLSSYDDVAARSDELKQIEDALMKEAFMEGVSFQVQRIVKPFALVAFAGKLAAEWGLVPWTPEQSFEASQSMLKAAIDARGNTGDFDTASGVGKIRQLIRQNMSQFYREGQKRSRQSSGLFLDRQR